ncbi:MAG: beta-N-acetylhexosaminidase [Prevotella sp.]|nr:beta-N-acetylhexosaminidase [Prevotella sp.]
MTTLLLSLWSFTGVVAQQMADFQIVPRPASVVVDAAHRQLPLRAIQCITYAGDEEPMARNARFLADYVKARCGLQLPVAPSAPKKTVAVRLQLNPQIAAEGYAIRADKSGLVVEGGTPQGVFYGIQALRQALPAAPADSVSLPYVSVSNTPRFAYRAMHLDVCRHFFGKSFVKQYIDMLALHGMNTLHWHLTDEQGWRIEIKSWPRLTEVGSVRRRTVIGRNTGLYDDTPHGGYFTQEDIREIVAYASQRYITIIPEIDMPGHMLAALAAYPELGCTGGPYEVCPDWGVFDDILCGGNPQTYRFLEDVVGEVIALFPSHIVHLGGDEAPKTRWKACAKCQQKIAAEGLVTAGGRSAEDQLQGYIVRHMVRFLAQHGRRLLGWDEILDCGVDSSAMIMSWRGEGEAVSAAERGYDIIMAPNSTLYFDFYQTPESDWSKPLLIGGYSPLEKVYSFEPVPATLSAEARRHIIGTQANIWSEYIAYKQLYEYQALPRMAALAEVQWVAPARKDYADFLKRLPRLVNIYQGEGWRYCDAALK